MRLGDEADGLETAAQVLDALATARVPDRWQVFTGALALLNVMLRGPCDRDLLDAAAGMDALATGTQLPLNDDGRARAATLAARVRREARQRLSHPTRETAPAP